MTPRDRQLDALLLVTNALERLDVDYAVGGSFASGVYGTFRGSEDVDVVARLKPLHVAALLRSLEPSFYVSRDAVLDAIRDRRAFNVIHLQWGEKVDVFCPPDGRWTEYQLRRRSAVVVDRAAGAEVYMVSPEDIVLAKLDWFRRGGGVSDVQWRDVLGVLKVQRDALHADYMDERAAELGVADLLKKARVEAGLD